MEVLLLSKKERRFRQKDAPFKTCEREMISSLVMEAQSSPARR